jgi:hypothetical protein
MQYLIDPIDPSTILLKIFQEKSHQKLQEDKHLKDKQYSQPMKYTLHHCRVVSRKDLFQGNQAYKRILLRRMFKRNNSQNFLSNSSNRYQN